MYNFFPPGFNFLLLMYGRHRKYHSVKCKQYMQLCAFFFLCRSIQWQPSKYSSQSIPVLEHVIASSGEGEDGMATADCTYSSHYACTWVRN